MYGNNNISNKRIYLIFWTYNVDQNIRKGIKDCQTDGCLKVNLVLIKLLVRLINRLGTIILY